MNKFRLTLRSLAIATLVFAFAALAQAQATRTWVSGVGDDVNPCSRTAPCKTWAGAISKTAAGGEIDALDPGGFGAVTITRPITIDGTGTFASGLNAGATGFLINSGTGNFDFINIRGVSINGAGSGNPVTGPGGVTGIRILEADRVNIEDVVINQSTTGILIDDATSVTVNIRNTVVRNCSQGLKAIASAGAQSISISNSSFISNTLHGMDIQKGATVTATDCVFSGNASVGVVADGAGGQAVVYLMKSQISNNGNGVQAGGGATTPTSIIRIFDCDITNNPGTAVIIGANGEVDTWQNNRIASNGTNGCAGCNPIGFN